MQSSYRFAICVLEIGPQSTFVPVEVPQYMSSPLASTTDVESTLLEPSTETAGSMNTQTLNEVTQAEPPRLQISTDTDSSRIEPPSPSTPASE